MPRIDDVYVCPICEDVFASEADAQECFKNHDEGAIILDIGWICDCGKAFRSTNKAFLHMSGCSKLAKSCDTCNNFEAGKYDEKYCKRHVPCPRFPFSDDMTACAEYTRIKAVK